MMTMRILAVAAVLASATLALVPVGTLGVVYAVLAACLLLVLVPVTVENLMTAELVEARAR